MKKKIFLILIVLTISVALFSCSSDGANLSNKETGQNYINDFLNGDFDKMVSDYNYDDTMQNAISADFLRQTYEALIVETGEVKSKAEAEEKSQSGYDIIYQNVTFENMDLTLNVVFDEDNLIAGFSITPVSQ